MNKKRIFSTLMLVLYTMLAQVVFAENPASRLHVETYRCANFTEPLQAVYINLGERRGFVQLDIPMKNIQSVSLSVLKQCLLQNGLMSREEFAAYSKAVEICRSAHYQKKVKYSRGDVMNTSTSKAFNFDYCLRDNLLN